MLSKSRKELWFAIIVLTAIVVWLTPDAAAGQRLVVQMSEPFEVAGTTYPAGELSLRPVRAYSPVATLNEVCVGGNCLGLFVAQATSGAPIARTDELLFARNSAGRLVLVGLAVAGQPTRSFAMRASKAAPADSSLVAAARN